MKTRAAVAFAAKQSLEIVELDLAGPKDGEVLAADRNALSPIVAAAVERI